MFRPCLAIFRSLHLTVLEKKTYTQLIAGGPVCGAGSWWRILAWYGEYSCCFGDDPTTVVYWWTHPPSFTTTMGCKARKTNKQTRTGIFLWELFTCQYHSIHAPYSSSSLIYSHFNDKWAKPGNLPGQRNSSTFIEDSRLTALLKQRLYCDRLSAELVQTCGEVSSRQMEKYGINSLKPEWSSSQ
jgi:hypothetical protein